MIKQFKMKLYVLLTYLFHYVIGESVTSLGLELTNDSENIVRFTCKMELIYRMVGYNCNKLQLKEIPQHLGSNMQVS